MKTSPIGRRSLLTAAFGGAATLAVAGSPVVLAVPAVASTGPDVYADAREHGVAGDGRTDDAPAINALIAELAASGGGAVGFSRGTYLLGSPLVLASGVHLVGGATGHGYVAAHPRATTVLLVAGQGLRGWMIDTPAGAVLGAGVAGIDLQGNGSCGGIRLRDASWCGVRRSHVNGCGQQGVLIGSGMACVLEDLLVTNCLLDRKRDRVEGALDVAGTDHWISRCEVTASLTSPSSDAKRVVAVALRGANHFVSDSVGETSDVGWWITADSSRFTGIRADQNLGDGVVVGGSGNVFAACSSIANSQHRTGWADGWVVRGGGNSFAACNVVTASSKLVRHGFTDSVNTREATARNSYAGCLVDRSSGARWNTEGFLGSAPGTGGHAVRPSSGSTRIDVTEAGVVVLWDYTRRTTIRAFTGGVDGQTIRVLGDPRVTIASNSAIVTASGRPLRTRRRGAVTFTRYDGVWYQSA